MNRRNVFKLAFAIVVLCFVLSTFVSLWSLRLMAAQNLRELSKTLAARIYDSIIGELSEPIWVSRTMANDAFLIDIVKHEQQTDGAAVEQALTEYLTRVKDSLGFEAAFVVTEGSRKYYSYLGMSKFMELERSERDQWYNHFIQSGEDYLLDVDLDEFSQDTWTVFVDARLEDQDGKLLGACGVGAQMTGSQGLFSELEREYGVKINLVDTRGIVQVDTDEALLETPFEGQFSFGGRDDYEFRQLSRDRIVVSKYIDQLGWYLVVQSDGSGQREQYIHVILLNVVLCLLVLVILILAMRIIASRTRTLTAASFTDQATQLLNRRAFEEEKAKLSMQALPEDLVYLTADLNGLKTANDTLGHAAGDELIRGAAECLRASLGRYGQLYRIGGDEFAGILRLPAERMPELLRGLEDTAAAWRGKLVDGVSVACGWASRSEFPSENISEIAQISDQRMYAAKEAYYQRTGKPRRKQPGPEERMEKE